jgi:hypothetical protein
LIPIRPPHPQPKPPEPLMKGIEKPGQSFKPQPGIEKPQLRKGKEGKSSKVPQGIEKPRPRPKEEKDRLLDKHRKGEEDKPSGPHRDIDKP